MSMDLSHLSVFFFKQKTAYELRISDWSSDVCSSDLPTASLDPAHQHATLRTARRAAERGIGVLAILHDLNLAAMYADRLAVLSHGRLAAEGAPAAVRSEEHTSELQSLMRISYAVFCLKKKKKIDTGHEQTHTTILY